MKKLLNKLFNYSKEDSLIRDSAIFFFASLTLSISGFIFHFFMGRFLGPESYGILGALFSLFYIFLVAFLVIQTTITNFVASYNSKHQDKKINVLLRSSLKNLFYIGIIATAAYISLSPIIAKFLNMPTLYVILMSPILLLSFLLPVTRGVMQGLQWFKKLGVNMTIEGLSKVSLGIFFVLMGMHISGAILAAAMAYVIPFFLSFYIIKKYTKKENEKIESKAVYSYSIPVIISLVIFTGFYTVDVLLVKHFLSDNKAGLYVALSFLGKIIFFGTQSIALVMFPKSVANFTSNKLSKKIVTKAMIIVTTIGGTGVLAYFILPKLVISILYGKEYLSISPVLGIYGLFMLLLSLNYVLVFYNLSQHKKSFNYILLLFLVIETLLLYIYHSSIYQIVSIIITLGITMYITLLVYTYKNE